MDLSGAGENNKKRVTSDEVREVEDDQSHRTEPKRSCPSLLTGFEAGSIKAEGFIAELWPQIEPLFRGLVREEVKSIIGPHIHSLLPSLSQKNKIEEEVTSGSGTSKIKLCFCNQIASIIFTNNEIKAENGEPLQVAICDVTNSNAIVYTGPLSSAQIEFVILDGEFSSGQNQEEALSDFKKSVLTPREGRRPLIVGNDLKLCLKNGVGFIKSLIITDNSSWIKSKKFRLGAIIRDENILAIFPRIGEAVSEPFRVMDHRGEVNRKHHPPSREDEVWRLEGIHKDGTYHKNLSSQDIKTVGDFLKAYDEMGPPSLKTLLGNKVPKKTWKMMVDNAHECVPVPVPVPTYIDQSFEQNLMGNKAIMAGEANFNTNFEIHEQKNLGDVNELPRVHLDEEWMSMINFEVADHSPPSLFSLGEASTSNEVGNCNVGTYTQYYQ